MFLISCLSQVGNAAFHDDLLYEELRRSIPQLTNLLISTEKDDIKVNAAGTLYSLVRHSNKLGDEIMSNGAIQVSSHFDRGYACLVGPQNDSIKLTNNLASWKSPNICFSQF